VVKVRKNYLTLEEAEHCVRTKYPDSRIVPPVTRFNGLYIFIIAKSDSSGPMVCDGHYSVDSKGRVEPFPIVEHPDYTIDNVEFIKTDL
jgi:hypothetical protein